MYGIIRIAFLCIVIGSASIPMSFGINSNPFIVWLGNSLGSLLSALFVIYIGEHLTSKKFEERAKKRRIGNKVITVFEEGSDNKKVLKVKFFVNRHGLRIFSFLCPIFPGVLIATSAVYIFDLDKKLYKKWMIAGVIFASGAYVFGYWWVFVK
jgi:hypothetical protein